MGMRRTLATIGLLALAAAWLGPLPRMAHGAFFAHMTMHMLVVAVAAPLVALAVAGQRYDPVRRWPAMFPPVPLSMVELVVVWAWHSPGLHHWARNGTVGLLAEQGTFLVAGLVVWLAAFGGAAPRDRQRSAAGVLALLLTSIHMTLLGALLALAPRQLYEHHHGAAGMTPLEDQHLGGAIMLLVGGIAYLSGGVWLTQDLVRQRCASERAETV